MAFYDQFVTFEKVSGDQSYACCPMHHDTNASFTVNNETDAWFCHGCGAGGHYVEFVQHYYDVGRDVAVDAVKQWNKTKRLPFPSEKYVEECVVKLQGKPAEIEVLHGFGITDEVIKHFRLGWDDMRITIPVYSRTGRLINVRKYLPPHRRIAGSNNAKCIGITHCNESRFYPYENLAPDKKDVYIVEGEKDCLAAISQGLNCVTSTGGSNLPAHEEMLFKGKNVYLMVDTDPAGARLREKYLQILEGIAENVQVIQLPCKDFVEYWEQYHNTEFNLYTLDVASRKEAQDAALAQAEERTSLTSSEFVENLNTWMNLKDMCVIGADPKTYTIPRKLRVKCLNLNCNHPCQVQVARSTAEIDIEPRQMLRFINSSDEAQSRYLRELLMCKSIGSEAAEYVNAQRIIFQENASFTDGLDDASFEPRYGIYLYKEQRLLPTVKYNFRACRVTDPRTQLNYYVIDNAEAVQSATDELTPETINYFKALAANVKSAAELIERHYERWESAVGIEQRSDLFGAILLTYSSVTEIPWKEGIIKGWLDTMVIGDTRTGKSQMAQRFVKQLQLGSYINGENARRTGVIGGVQQIGDSWLITWGAIPMNDKGLLVIDEASGLEVDDIKELSAARSSGAVTINKIAKGEARARTRLIWLSNPRSGRNIDEFFWKGYGAFQEFIPVVEDQARYDMVLSAARSDVARLTGNLRNAPLNEYLYKSLFGFAWNTSADNIIISKETQATVKESVKYFADKYEGGPLIVSVAVHEKILRIACAFAVLCGSISSKKLFVQPEHVKFAQEFLESTLVKPSMDYASYIKEARRVQAKKEEHIKFIRGLVSQHPAIRILLSSNSFKGGQLAEVLGIEKSEGAKILSELLTRGLLKISYRGGYKPDSLLVDVIRQMEV